ncbi:MAG: DEAD/DEAH box helicase [Desulfobacterales bacterium]|nr:DEAD/DEAH box helicase [Desulfobacterales bacterium]
MEKFKALGLSDNTIRALSKKGFEEPTEIQTMTIPLILKNEMDIIAQAQTGTGKTAAFALPLIEHLDENSKKVQAIIIAPTRELVIQVCEEINSLKGSSEITAVPIYGGQSIDMQLRKLSKGVSIVVGTPGRVLDHINRKTLKLNDIRYFILDEADEMLNMGFIEDVETILESTPSEKRVLLFSATMPSRIKKLAEKYMGKYVHLKTATELTTDLTDQIYFEVAEKDKLEALCRIIDLETDFYGLVFCRTKIEVNDLVSRLFDRGYSVDGIHGDISQVQRERTLEKFRKRQTIILVATDVAARGIDIINLTHVINYSIPQNPEAYIHRIGRTGRAGQQGTAITFITSSEFRNLGFIRRIVKADIRKENVPRVQDIMESKKKKIEADIQNIIANEDILGYKNWAKNIIQSYSVEDVIAAILKYSFGKMLDERNYQKLTPVKQRREKIIEEPKKTSQRKPKQLEKPYEKENRSERIYHDDMNVGRTYVEQKGKTRIFVAKGKKTKTTKHSLLEFIIEVAGTPKELIENIEIYDNFSFITVPFAEAEIILQKFKKIADGSRSLVEKAKPVTSDKETSKDTPIRVVKRKKG